MSLPVLLWPKMSALGPDAAVKRPRGDIAHFQQLQDRSAWVVPVDAPPKAPIALDRHWRLCAVRDDVVAPTAVEITFYLDLDTPVVDLHPLRFEVRDCRGPTVLGNPSPVSSGTACHQCACFGIYRLKLHVVMRRRMSSPDSDNRYCGQNDHREAGPDRDFSEFAHPPKPTLTPRGNIYRADPQPNVRFGPKGRHSTICKMPLQNRSADRELSPWMAGIEPA